MTAPAGRVSDRGAFRDPAFMANREAPVHRWIPWIAGFSRQFVQDALARHLPEPGVVLDPFAGVGTTLVEADIAGHAAVGFEINPYAAFAARAKLGAHRLEAAQLRAAATDFLAFMEESERTGRAPKASAPASFRTRAPFYSPAVERKVLLAFDFMETLEAPSAALFRLAFAATMVGYSNYSYEPSLGRKVSVGRPEVEDDDVAGAITAKLYQMVDDAAWYRDARANSARDDGRVLEKSFFEGHSALNEGSVDLLVTSPPYLNNYHYNRNTRPHLYWLGFCASPSDLKRLEAINFGTYWQNARDEAHVDLDPSIDTGEIREAIDAVRQRNPEKGVYGGNGWANYAARYFNDCARFLDGAARCLRPGATALVVIGNSILQGVPIPTDRFLAAIATSRGFQVVDIHIPRETRVGNSIVESSVRAGKANGSALYESVVELRRL
ncbi:MAG: DNA methyltransferase [Rhodospirillales bacterium]|nr:DNA methyltransferase [Rhodospirillales bacterium]